MIAGTRLSPATNYARSAGESLYPNLWRGLKTSAMFWNRGGGPVDPINGTQYTGAVAGQWSTVEGYPAYEFIDVDERLVANTATWDPVHDITMIVCMESITTPSGSFIVSPGGNASSSRKMEFSTAYSGSAARLVIEIASSRNDFTWDQSGLTRPTGIAVWAFNRKADDTSDLYVNGKFIATHSGGAGDITGGPFQMIYGGLKDSFPSTECKIVSSYQYDRALSGVEVNLFTNNYYAPFVMKSRVIGKAPAAVGGLGIPVAMHHYTKNIGAF